MSQDTPLAPDAPVIAKLKKSPVEVEVGLYDVNPNYVETDDTAENLKNLYLKKGSIKAWLHPLTWLERDFIKADTVKIYRFWKENDGDNKDIAKAMVNEAIQRLLVYFALKRGPEEKAARLFESQDEMLDFHPPTLRDLNVRYYEEFGLSEKERGNLLRARSSGTFCALPDTSLGKTSSDQT